MSTQLSSDFVVKEADPGIPSVTGRVTDVVGFVGVAERGPLDQPMLVQSWDEYKRIFGGFTSTADLALAAWCFFMEVGEGSKECWFSRIVHRVGGTAQSAKGTTTLATTAVGTAAQNTLRVDGKTTGAYANAIKIRIVDATDAAVAHFNLQVEVSGVAVEVWQNLDMDPDSASYPERIINDAGVGSDLIAVGDLHAPITHAAARPVNVLTAVMTGGDDGLTAIADADYTGVLSTKTGLYALDAVADLDVLVVPNRATATVQTAMVAYCETTRAGKCFAILDPPASNSKSDIVTYVDTTAALGGTTQKAAMYWPRPRITNPSTTIFGVGTTYACAYSGGIAGFYCRVAAESKQGKFTQPAGITYRLRGVVGFEGEDDLLTIPHAVRQKTTRDYVFPRRINPLRKDRNTGYYIDGEYTLKSGLHWPTVGEARGAVYVEKAIEEALQTARHRDNNDRLREECRSTVYAFLRDECDKECFASLDPSLAFFVDFGTGLNTAAVIRANQIKGRVGIATNAPAIFGNVEISQDTRAYDAAAAQG